MDGRFQERLKLWPQVGERGTRLVTKCKGWDQCGIEEVSDHRIMVWSEKQKRKAPDAAIHLRPWYSH